MARILLVGEATWLQTGYSTYALQIARELVEAGHEVAEIACYGDPNDPRRANNSWPAFFITEQSQSYPPAGFYNSQPAFGSSVFEEAVLGFMPDVVISARDPWTDAFISYSPVRPFFRWIYMHPVDGEPQDEEWIASVHQADAVLAYSDYGVGVLSKYPGLKLAGVAAPGAESSIFRPIEKETARKTLGIPTEALVVGTVMRNQTRKLFPELFQSFRKLLEQSPPHISRKLYLYCHTAWPDVGWDLPKYLIRNSISHRTLLTFGCRDCGRPFASLWQEPASSCPFCRSGQVSTPTVSLGLPREVMGAVYSSMDACVQYSVCEGFGMPQVESAYCGTPVFSVDHTAMGSVCRTLGGTLISVGRTYSEPETGRILALPDNEELVRKLSLFLSLPDPARRASGGRQREAALSSFSYAKAGSVWLEAIANLSPPSRSYSSSKINLPEPMRPSDALTNYEWVEAAFISSLGMSMSSAGYLGQRMVRDISRGYCDSQFVSQYFCKPGPSSKMFGFDRDCAWKIFLAERRRLEFWEGRRS
jgi:glycosyltransferase involved in cell wall biosynthesis